MLDQEPHDNTQCFLSGLSVCRVYLAVGFFQNIVGCSHTFHRLSIQPISFFSSRLMVKRVPVQRIWYSHTLSPTYLQFQSVASNDFVLLAARTIVAGWLSVHIIGFLTSLFSGGFSLALVYNFPSSLGKALASSLSLAFFSVPAKNSQVR